MATPVTRTLSSTIHPIDSPSGDGAAEPPAAWWRRHWAGLLLILITLGGGALRFIALDHPALWGDEAATYARICGTFRDLLDQLRVAWFPPLHYLLYWWMSRHIPMDPFGMRLVPAIAGTLMIPAIYFLARQMVAVRESLLAALLTASSAFILAYSRDAKMYMEFWLCLTISTACLMWWARTSNLTAWLGWLAAGTAMVGLHGMGFAMLPLHLLIFLSSRRISGPKTLALVLGFVVMSTGDIVHYSAFNAVADHIERQGWEASGIDWTNARNQGHPASLLLADSAGAFLFSFMWICEQGRWVVMQGIQSMMAWVLGVFGLIALLGAIPWRRRTIPPFKSDRDTTEPSWRVGLWLGAWMVLPTYAIYCASFDHPVSPAYWLSALVDLTGGRLWVLMSAVVLGCLLTQLSPIFLRVITYAVAPLLVGGILLLGFNLFDTHSSADAMLQGELAGLTPIVLVPLLASIAALWFNRLGMSLKTRLVGLLRFVLVVGGLVALCFVLYGVINGYFADRQFVLDQEQMGSGGRKSVWMPRWLAVIWPALAVGMSILLMRLPAWPLRWTAILFVIGVNLAQFTARLRADTEAPLATIAADIMTGHDDPAVVTFLGNRRRGGAPGTTSIDEAPGAYYLHRLNPSQHPSFDGLLENRLLRNLDVPRYYYALSVSPARNDPRVRRIIVWTSYEAGDQIRNDSLERALGAKWKPVGDRVYHVRSFWNWAESFQYRRREFAKVR